MSCSEQCLTQVYTVFEEMTQLNSGVRRNDSVKSLDFHVYRDFYLTKTTSLQKLEALPRIPRRLNDIITSAGFLISNTTGMFLFQLTAEIDNTRLHQQ